MMNPFRTLAPVIALAATLVLIACEKKRESARVDLPAVPVRVQKVEAKPHVAREDVVGTVNPKLRAVIEAKVSGRIDRMLATPGQHVKAGELLAELDVREIQARLDQANAVREQTESDRKRFADLLAKRAVTQQEFEAVESRARVARAAVTEEETMLGYARITAPFAGVITRKLADVGDLASPGKPLLEMEDPSALRFEAGVPETIIGRIEPGAKLDVRIGEKEMEGTVSEIAPAADPTSRTSLVKLDLPPTPGLRAGQFGRVSVPLSESAVLRVPASAVIRRGQMELLFVLKDGRAELRLVKTGKQIGDEIEVVSGVEAGEQVITEGAAGLVDGQPVEVRQ
jgi:RND family efflux transporter MFP subunit